MCGNPEAFCSALFPRNTQYSRSVLLSSQIYTVESASSPRTLGLLQVFGLLLVPATSSAGYAVDAVAEASYTAKTDAAGTARKAAASDGVPRKLAKAPSLRKQAHVGSHLQQKQHQQQLRQPELPWYDEDTLVWSWRDDNGMTQVRAVPGSTALQVA